LKVKKVESGNEPVSELSKLSKEVPHSTTQSLNHSTRDGLIAGNLEFRSDLLLSEIQKVAGVTKTRSLMPILKNVLIELEGSEGRVYATDLEISAITRFDLLGFKLDKSFGLVRLCINAALLQDVLKGLRPVSGLPFTMMIPAAKDKITIKQDNGLHYEACLALSDPDEFPEVKVLDEGEEINISANLINEAISKVSYAMSKDETRYVLTGLFLQIIDENLVAAGTDGFRMAVWKRKLKGEKGSRVQGVEGSSEINQPINHYSTTQRFTRQRFILPSNMVNILNILTDPKKVELLPLGPVTIKYGSESNVVQFALPTVTIISKRIMGQYPDHAAAIPTQNPYLLQVKRDVFVDALKRVLVVSVENEPVRTLWDNGLLCLEVSSIAGTATERIDASYTGESFDLMFNARFLLDVLHSLENDTVNMHCPEGYAAVLIDEISEDGTAIYQNVIMPIRT
jgi:DNA polymerase III subunit beta